MTDSVNTRWLQISACRFSKVIYHSDQSQSDSHNISYWLISVAFPTCKIMYILYLQPVARIRIRRRNPSAATLKQLHYLPSFQIYSLQQLLETGKWKLVTG